MEHHGKILKSLLLDENNLSHKVIENFTGYKKVSIEHHFGSKVLKQRILKAYANAFGISLKKFGLNYAPHTLGSFQSRRNTFISLGLKETKLEESFFKKYYSSISKWIKSGKEKIVIYQHLSLDSDYPDDNEEMIKWYLREKRNYLSSIQQILEENPHLKYTRVMALPLNAFDEGEVSSSYFILRKALEICEFEIFEHMWICLNSFGNRCFLYLLDIPSRLYSFGYIDDQHAITQYDRFRRDGTSRLDSLFVETVNKDDADDFVKKLIEVYQYEVEEKLIKGTKVKKGGIEKAVSRTGAKVGLNEIKPIIENLFDEYIDNMRKINNELEETKKITNPQKAYEKREDLNERKEKLQKKIDRNIKLKFELISKFPY